MATIQIRDVPDDAYTVMRQRARGEGRSLQAYMRGLVVAAAGRRTAGEALVDVERRLRASTSRGSDPSSVRRPICAPIAGDRQVTDK